MLKKILILTVLLLLTVYIAIASQYSAVVEIDYKRFKSLCENAIKDPKATEDIKKEIRISLDTINSYYNKGTLTDEMIKSEFAALEAKINPQMVQTRNDALKNKDHLSIDYIEKIQKDGIMEIINDPSAPAEIKAQAREMLKQTEQYWSDERENDKKLEEWHIQKDKETEQAKIEEAKRQAYLKSVEENGVTIGNISYKWVEYTFPYSGSAIWSFYIHEKMEEGCSKNGGRHLITVSEMEHICNDSNTYNIILNDVFKGDKYAVGSMAVENGQHYMMFCNPVQRNVMGKVKRNEDNLYKVVTPKGHKKGEYMVPMLCTAPVLHLKENK